MFKQYNYIPACVHSLSPKIPEFPINMFEQYNYIPACVHSLSPKIPEFPITPNVCSLSVVAPTVSTSENKKPTNRVGRGMGRPCVN
jgi:hypothetical protein